MTKFGKVTAVTEEPVGTTLSQVAVASATSIVVDDASQLDWPSGTLTLDDGTNSEAHAYTIAVAPVQSIDVIDLNEDDDVDEATVTLVGALAHTYAIDTLVTQYPQTTEKFATVLLNDQQEELVVRVPQHLTDRLPTGIRDQTTIAGSSETIELAQSESDYVMADMVSEEGTGLDRAQVERSTPLTVTADDPASAQIVCSVNIVIPTTAHRIIVSYAAHIGNPSSPATGTSDCFLGFADDGQDFDTPVLLADYDHSAAIVNPQLAIPMLPLTSHDTGIVAGGLIESTARLFNDYGGFTPFMPYVITPPTVGLHNFRLVAWTGVGGTGRVTDASLWITVI